ncbi:hypothetical protein JTB14_013874 [Gonioctena quinquepunctata]|nr:hypothetical protein JTB14_013874 [Gonioctena quinquepunctata]
MWFPNVQAVEKESQSENDEQCYVNGIKANNDSNAWTQELQETCEEKTFEPKTFKFDIPADNVAFECAGCCETRPFQHSGYVVLKYKNREIVENVFVPEDIDIPLVNRKACQNLNLVKRIDTDVNWFEKYSTLFMGLCNMQGQYKIEIRSNVIQYVILPKALLVPLKTQLKEASDDMPKKCYRPSRPFHRLVCSNGSYYEKMAMYASVWTCPD